MTLAAAVAPLAAYAVLFQTAVYLSMPVRIRTTWAPVVIGAVGAMLVLVSGALFGFDSIGLAGADPVNTLFLGLAAVVATSVVAVVMLHRPSLRRGMIDPRLGSLTRRQAVAQIFIRIPVFTALIEEAVFRGVLHAALVAIYPTHLALWLGAGLFGLWHIGPALHQADATDQAAGRTGHTAVTVIGTTLAGAFLVWLRVETGSIWAPVAVHSAMNMTMAVLARAISTESTAAG